MIKSRQVYALLVASTAWMAAQSCSTPELEPAALPPSPASDPLPDPPKPIAVEPTPETPAFQLQALNRVLAEHPELAASVQDTHAILVAQEAVSRGDYPAATKAWFEALSLAKGSFAKTAFEGWVKSYTNALGKTADPLVLARLVLAETQNGTLSPYMLERGLTHDEALVPVLTALVPQWAKVPAGDKTKEAEPTLSPPPAAHGIPPHDPLLTKSAVHACHSHSGDSPAWQAWQETLPSLVLEYWQALKTDACGHGAAATTASFKALYPKLGLNPVTQGLAVEAAGRTATLQRAVGQRHGAADTYTDLMVLWGKAGVTPASMGLDDVSLGLRRIDETLWATRYRALLGDYENAKIYAQKSLDLSRLLSARRAQLKHAQKEQLAGLIADAYHTLAFRIAVEQHQFSSALALNLVGLSTPDLPLEWQERLTWLAGLYDYLGGNYASAEERWHRLQSFTHDENLRAAGHFWSGRAFAQLGREAEAKAEITQLLERYPLSYYGTVAVSQAQLTDAQAWQKGFGDLAVLNASLTRSRDYQIQHLRTSPRFGLLLSRAEILAAADLGPLARQAVRELDTAMSAALPVAANMSAFVYLSRLQYRAGSYLAAIGLTTKLAKSSPEFWHQWPEQVLIAFPRPYPDEYRANAEESSVSQALLRGISRQESGFTADIRSSANAIGVMQLIPSTARQYAEPLGLPLASIDQLLRQPAVNIRLGSHYLKFLTANYKGFDPAVYAAYNAGEYVVDTWLQTRSSSDPLVFVELIPFGETKDYVKSVWRNVLIYRTLDEAKFGPVLPALDLGFAGLRGA